MNSILRLLFTLWIAPAFGMFVVTPTVQTSYDVPGSNGQRKQRRVRISLLLDNAYPVAGYALTPAMFGLFQFTLNAAQNGFLDPEVIGVNQSGLLAEVVGLKLLLSFPTGGTDTAPAVATTSPLTKSGAATASAVDATRPNLTPGAGKACANGMDASAITVFLEATGLATANQ